MRQGHWLSWVCLLVGVWCFSPDFFSVLLHSEILWPTDWQTEHLWKQIKDPVFWMISYEESNGQRNPQTKSLGYNSVRRECCKFLTPKQQDAAKDSTLGYVNVLNMKIWHSGVLIPTTFGQWLKLLNFLMVVCAPQHSWTQDESFSSANVDANSLASTSISWS